MLLLVCHLLRRSRIWCRESYRHWKTIVSKVILITILALNIVNVLDNKLDVFPPSCHPRPHVQSLSTSPKSGMRDCCPCLGLEEKTSQKRSKQWGCISNTLGFNVEPPPSYRESMRSSVKWASGNPDFFVLDFGNGLTRQHHWPPV